MPHQPASQALKRFKVLDLTRVRAGPTCVRQLADWGADVIKIEQPPEPGEGMGGPRNGPDFQNLHRNKRGLTLNLKQPEGLDVFKVKMPASLAGKTIAESGIRRNTGCTIIALELNGATQVNPDPTKPLPHTGQLILIGSAKDENRFLETFMTRRKPV